MLYSQATGIGKAAPCPYCREIPCSMRFMFLAYIDDDFNELANFTKVFEGKLDVLGLVSRTYVAMRRRDRWGSKKLIVLDIVDATLAASTLTVDGIVPESLKYDSCTAMARGVEPLARTSIERGVVLGVRGSIVERILSRMRAWS
jgi:hypothetical protein